MAKAYNTAKDKSAAFGVDTEKVLKILDSIPLSMHCWQGDDVGGFEVRQNEVKRECDDC